MKLSAYAVAVAVALLAGPAAQAQAHNPRDFLKDAIEGDNSEMMLGKIAAERGSTPQVRAYGQALYDDHAAARIDAVRVAGQLGVPETSKPMPEAAKEREKLGRLHGRDFDREFAAYMIKDHKKDIAEFRSAVRFGGPAGQLAQSTLPVLQRHLEMAQRLGA